MDLARWTPFVAAVIVLLYALLATGLVNVQARRSLMAAQNTAVLGLGYPPYHMGPVTDITYSGPDSAGMLQVNLFSHILHDQEAGTLVMDEIRPYEDGLVSGWYYAFDGDLFSFETGGLWACWVDTTFPVLPSVHPQQSWLLWLPLRPLLCATPAGRPEARWRGSATARGMRFRGHPIR